MIAFGKAPKEPGIMTALLGIGGSGHNTQTMPPGSRNAGRVTGFPNGHPDTACDTFFVVGGTGRLRSTRGHDTTAFEIDPNTGTASLPGLRIQNPRLQAAAFRRLQEFSTIGPGNLFSQPPDIPVSDSTLGAVQHLRRAVLDHGQTGSPGTGPACVLPMGNQWVCAGSRPDILYASVPPSHAYPEGAILEAHSSGRVGTIFNAATLEPVPRSSNLSGLPVVSPDLQRRRQRFGDRILPQLARQLKK